ncbi:cellulose biosynthesis protein BcsD [Kluyvera intermedia]|nr:cellulose biosynthesis protein BcsD [Kluyvera intermedia]
MTISDTTDEYYRQQQYVPGWQDLSTLLCSSILSAADRNEGRIFLQHVGNQLALKFPLRQVETLGLLEDEVNHLLARFNWGRVHIIVDEQGLTINHIAWPHAGQMDELPTWTLGFASLMEGCWKEWLRTQGGSELIAFTLVEGKPSLLVFRYEVERG